MKKLVRLAALIAASSFAIYTPACGSDETPHEEENTELADVVYESGATDEALEALLGAKATDDAAKGATITSPKDASDVPADAPPTFTWSVGGSGASLLPAAAPPHRSGQGDRGFSLELFGPERSAAAHGAPVNGKAYFLVFSTSKDDKLLRVFTTSLTYTPDEAAWDKMKAAGTWITVTVLTGTFDNNLLAADGGPFAGPKSTFQVKAQ